MASSNHTEGSQGAASVVIGQPQQHNVSSPNKYNASYSKVSSILFGLLQIVLCVASIAGAAMIEMHEGSGDELGTGFWCGAVYAVAGGIATAAGWYAPKNMLIAVAVFSFLDIPFGIAAVVLATEGIIDDVDCNANYCKIRNSYAVAGNAMICATGFWEIVFGLCLLIISVRAICLGSKPQVSSVPVYYTSSVQETVQMNPTTSQHATSTNGAVQRTQRTTEENQYETLEQNKF